jgi:hypothetical protein
VTPEVGRTCRDDAPNFTETMRDKRSIVQRAYAYGDVNLFRNNIDAAVDD